MSQIIPSSTDLDDEKYYTVRQVAEVFSVTEQTVRLWINERDERKRLNAIKVGRGWRVTKSAMSDFANRTYPVK